jgi:bromodomain-containing factor 1
MGVSDHPLPTLPSIPDQVPSPRQSEDPHPAVVDAFTSDVRDQPSSPNSQSPLFPTVPQGDLSIGFDRAQSEPAMTMDVDEQPSTTEMVNGHKANGEYMAENMFSGAAVGSPELTNEPTPPPTHRPAASASFAPPSLPAEQTSKLTSTLPQPTTQLFPIPQQPKQAPASVVTGAKASTVMEDVQQFKAPSPKSFHEPPRTTDEPPAKRLKTESSPPSYDMSKKMPANQQKFLTALIRQVKKGKDAMPFREPVDPVRLNIPRYFDIIDQPMDLSTIEKKLIGSAYPVVQAVVDDFNLMVENCVKFNGPDNPVTKMGKNMQATFEKGMKTLPPEQAPPPPKPVAPIAPPIAAPPKPKSPAMPAPPRRPSGAFPPIRRESLTVDGRPKREIKPPPERDIPMDKPRLRKKNAVELRFCQTVMKELQKKIHEPYSYPFLVPVDPVALNIPDYFKIIKNPMDLGTIDTKLKEQQYSAADEFYQDVKLIFKNCYKYNGIDSPVSGLAKQLEKVVDKKWLEKPEEPPEKPAGKRALSSSPPREEESSSEEDEIGRIQEQMTLMAKRLSEMQSRKKQQRQEKSPTVKGKGNKGGAGGKKRSLPGSSKPKKPKEYIPEVTFEQKRELSEKINFLSPSKMQGVLELIKDAMPLDSVFIPCVSYSNL